MELEPQNNHRIVTLLALELLWLAEIGAFRSAVRRMANRLHSDQLFPPSDLTPSSVSTLV